VKDGQVVAVESLAGRAPDEARDRRALETAAEHLERLAPDWRAVFAVGDEVADLGALAPAREEARLAIEIRERLGRRERVFKVKSLGAFRLILKASSGADAVELCRQTLAPVLEHDRKRRSGLLPTFRTYLECGGAVKGAATRLGVHPHTVEYRLGRLQELTGLDLRRHEDRLTLELALRVLEIGSPDLGH
jgi:purine catabolism regulator